MNEETPQRPLCPNASGYAAITCFVLSILALLISISYPWSATAVLTESDLGDRDALIGVM